MSTSTNDGSVEQQAGLAAGRPLPTVAEEREHRRLRLVGALRVFALLGLDSGLAGHITVRDPEHLDCFWVNPFAVPFRSVGLRDLLLVDASGRVVEGDRPVNAAAFAIHSRLHEARPDVVAAAHSHSPHGVAWSTLGRHLDPISQDACAFYADHGVFTDYTGVVYDVAEGDRIAGALGSGKAVILQNHGLLTVGGSVDEAAWWFIAMERACQVQLAAEAAGEPVHIEPAMAELTSRQIGSAAVGFMNFQPLWDLVAEAARSS